MREWVRRGQRGWKTQNDIRTNRLGTAATCWPMKPSPCPVQLMLHCLISILFYILKLQHAYDRYYLNLHDCWRIVCQSDASVPLTSAPWRSDATSPSCFSCTAVGHEMCVCVCEYMWDADKQAWCQVSVTASFVYAVIKHTLVRCSPLTSMLSNTMSLSAVLRTACLSDCLFHRLYMSIFCQNEKVSIFHTKSLRNQHIASNIVEHLIFTWHMAVY